MARKDELTDEQWAILEPLIPEPERRADGKGRPPLHDNRSVMNGILWVLRTGAAWNDLPDRYPSSTTCFRRFSVWVGDGVMRKILEALAQNLEERGGIDLAECFIDGTFVVAKKGAPKWERPSGAKVRSSWLLQTLMVFLSPCTRLLLAHMKSPLSKLRSMKPSRWDDPDDLSGIVPTTVIRSIKGWHKTVLK
jgi:transposase